MLNIKRFRQNKLAKNERGQVLSIVLVLLMLGSILISPTLIYASTTLISVRATRERANQLYAADAGVEDAIWQLQQTTPDPNKVPDATGGTKTYGNDTAYPMADVNGKHLTITIYKQDSSTYRIVSNATGNNSTTTVTSYVVRVGGLFDVAIRALNGNIFLDNNVVITDTSPTHPPYDADLSANGSISLGSNVSVNGDATASGAVTGTSGVKGTATGGAPNYVAPSIDTSVYETESQVITTSPVYPPANYTNGGTIPGNARLSGNFGLNANRALTVNGNLYIDGSLDIGSYSSLIVNGSLYVNGYVLTFNGGTLKIGGKLYVDSYLDVSNNTTLTLGGTTYVNGYMALGNNANWPLSQIWLGSYAVVAKGSITFNNNCNVAPAGISLLFCSQTGNITFENNCDMLSGYLYAPNGDITLSNNVNITGALVANNVSVSNNIQVTFTKPNSSNSDLPSSTGGQLTVKYWSTN